MISWWRASVSPPAESTATPKARSCTVRCRLRGEAIWLHPVSPDYDLRGAAELGSATGMLNVFVEDVDKHYARSMAAGAKIVFPPADQPYGQREYGVSDPEGRLWSFATRT